MQTISVSEFNTTLNEMFSQMPEFAVEGEITKLSFSKGNAVFIDLKDLNEQAMLRLSNYAPAVRGLKAIDEGMHVVVYGSPNIYSQYGSFSLKIRKIEPMGEGALKLAFEKLKRELEHEGLFAPERKRKLKIPMTRIALITGKDSAAYSDFCKILEEGNCGIEIDFYPVLVQGEKSEDEVRAALRIAAQSDVDAIVLTRGGGSLEDLKSFNSEGVAREIFASEVPVVCAIGHEIDVSIAELVADRRASTPSQAAYYILKPNQSLLERFEQKFQEVEQLIAQMIPQANTMEQFAEKMLRRLEFGMPGTHELKEKLGQIEFRLTSKLPSRFEYKEKVITLEKGISQLLHRLNIYEQKLDLVQDCESKLVEVHRQLAQKNLAQQQLIKAYNPDGVLKRGFSLITKNGKYIGQTSQLTSGDEIELKLQDGELPATIN